MRVEGWRTNLTGPLAHAARIVSVGPSNTEILHALGLGRRIVGVDRWSDYPPRVQTLTSVGSDLRVDVPTVVNLRPDLVVASLHVPGMEANVPAFESAGLAYVAVGGVGLNGVWDDLRVIGHYVGRSSRAEALVARMQTSMAALPVERARRPRVHWEWSAHPVIAGGRSWITELLELAGAENVYADLDVESVRVSYAEVVARQPDVVVACWCGVRRLPTVEKILARPGWQTMRAFQRRQVAVLSEAYFGRPGPRLVEGLEQLRTLLQ
ncbi:MAG: cobalamin-binding protein [Chloroflexi bacterium]|nr:cobalamin-binding protein [Chloroflexota bacterium]